MRWVDKIALSVENIEGKGVRFVVRVPGVRAYQIFETRGEAEKFLADWERGYVRRERL